ncbi:MAG: DUF2914 domain-containing protein [Deltaproteobacteria bacterium]|nr:DUF2914 domain-containing protein [Deltaproteobacteria bacterium]
MNDDAIEARDRRFRDKLLDLRSELVKREAHFQRERAERTTTLKSRRNAFLLLGLGVLSGGTYLGASLASDPDRDPEPATQASVLAEGSAPAAPVVASTAGEAPAEPSRVQIIQRMVCRSISRRACVGARDTFGLSERGPNVWMEVRSASLPRVLKHVYYLDGEKQAEIALKVRHERTRTWSRLSMRDRSRVGSWRVQIETEDGAVLDQVSFRVTL